MIVFHRGKSEYVKLYNFASHYDILSIDIFDTLLVRLVETPLRVFENIEKYGNKYNIDNFAEKRIQAQADVAKEKGKSTQIIDIYKCLMEKESIAGEDVLNDLIDTELEFEAKSCIVNKTILKLVEDVLHEGKIVIFISDMYLRHSDIIKLLKIKKVDLLTEGISSCDVGKGKADGTLFSYVANYFPNKKILHIGDSFRSDFLNARKHDEFNSVWFPFRRKCLTEKFFEICNSKNRKYDLVALNSLISEKSFFYQWGYDCLAPSIWSFCNWLEKKAENDNVDTLLFLTREGAFLKSLFDIYQSEHSNKISTKLLYASRKSVMGASCNLNWDDIYSLYKNGSFYALKKDFDIPDEEYKNVLKKYSIDESLRLSDVSGGQVALEELKDFCIKYSLRQKEIFKSYLNELKLGPKVGLVDIGWKGSMQKYLERIFNSTEDGIEVFGYYWGEIYSDEHKQLKKDGFLCSSKNDVFLPQTLNAGYVLELSFGADFGSTSSYGIDNTGRAIPILDKNTHFKADEVQDIQSAVKDYFHEINAIYPTYEIDRVESIRGLFKNLNNPSLSFSERMGDLAFYDLGAIRYVAKPDKMVKYLKLPGKLKRDLHYCGWNSGFCRRLFKIPFPYYAIYRHVKFRK